jgi:hypothetical protein
MEKEKGRNILPSSWLSVPAARPPLPPDPSPEPALEPLFRTLVLLHHFHLSDWLFLASTWAWLKFGSALP